MRIKIRLYKAHDPDLILLSRCGIINVPDAAKQALISYYKKDGAHAAIEQGSIPEGKTLDDLMPKSRIGKSEKCIVHVISVSDKDAEGIEDWIRQFGKGYMTCFIKSILRIYLGVVPDWITQQVAASGRKETVAGDALSVDNISGKPIHADDQAEAKPQIEADVTEVTEDSFEEMDPTSLLLSL